MTKSERLILSMASIGIVVTLNEEERAARRSMIERGFIEWRQETVGILIVAHDVLTGAGRHALMAEPWTEMADVPLHEWDPEEGNR
jgi:hypothetical protein